MLSYGPVRHDYRKWFLRISVLKIRHFQQQ